MKMDDKYEIRKTVSQITTYSILCTIMFIFTVYVYSRTGLGILFAVSLILAVLDLISSYLCCKKLEMFLDNVE